MVSVYRKTIHASPGCSVTTGRLMKISLFLRMLFVIALVVATSAATLISVSARAETVSMVKDINPLSKWQILHSLSNGRVAFHVHRRYSSESVTMLRSTKSATTTVGQFSVREIRRAFLTEKYLYIPQRGNRGKWVDRREIGFSEPFRDRNTGATYFLNNENGAVRLTRLNERTATFESIRTLPDTDVEGYKFVLGSHIVFNGQNSIWRIGKSGDNRVRLARMRNWNSNNPVVGKRLAYIPVTVRVAGSQHTQCSLWRTDGSKRGTWKIADLTVGVPDPGSLVVPYWRAGDACNPETAIVDGDKALFKKVNFNTGQVEIWETRGSIASTRRIKRLPLNPTRADINPESTHLGLSVIDDSVWYKMYGRNLNPVVFVGDTTLRNTRRVLAGRKQSVIDLIPVADHMLLQIDNDGVNSTLFKTDASGNNLSRLYNGRNRLDDATDVDALDYTGAIVTVGDQILFPYKPAGKKWEVLLSHELSTATTKARRRWQDSTDSSALGEKIVPGPGDSAYICAFEGKGYKGSRYRKRPGFWRTDGTAANTRNVISTSPYNDGRLFDTLHKTECGPVVAASGDRLYFVRQDNTNDTGRELWRANLDGTDQRLFIDLKPGPGNSDPQQIVGISDGVIFTALPVFGVQGLYWPTKLFRAYQDGAHEILAEGHGIEIQARTGNLTGDRVWFWIYERDTRQYSLWRTDGTAASTVKINEVARGIDDNAVGFVELNGDTYFAVSKRWGQPQSEWRIYKIAQGSTQAESANWRRGLLMHMEVVDNQIHVLQRGDQGRSVIARLRTSTGELTPIVDSALIGGTDAAIQSFTVVNNQIYFYQYLLNEELELRWQIWRSSGAPGDAVKIFEEGPDATLLRGQLTATATSIYFLTGGDRAGVELWQIKP